ncbi:MAG: FtsX-like permease family protein [Fimbriiglobus sp.]
MLPIYRLLSLRYLIQRWDRAGLIIVSIAMGVATLVSSRVLNQCVEAAASQTTSPLGSGDLFISNGEFGVARSLTDELRAANIPGVKSVQPLVVERVVLPQQDKAIAVLLGVELSWDWLKADQPNPLGVRFTRTLEETRATAMLLFTRRIVVVSEPVHREWARTRETPTSPLIVRFGSRDVECLPVGYFESDPDSPITLLGKNIIGMEIVQASRFVRLGPTVGTAAVVGNMANETLWEAQTPARVNRIDVLFEPSVNPVSVASAVKAIVKDRAEVRTPESHGQSSQEIISGIQIAFSLCSASAMIVGLFLVYNALSVTVAERRHDIGILRSLGATRWQVIKMFAVAAAILGLLGSLLGVPIGTLMARQILAEFSEELGALFLNPGNTTAWPGLSTIGLAILAGMTTAIVAALIPAIQAATQDPADAVRRVPGAVGGLWALAHKATCGTLIAGGVAMILTRDLLPPRVGAFGGMMAALVGLLLAAPILVGILVRLLHPIFRLVLPIEARLAADHLIRSPGRTGVVIGALGAGVAVMFQTAGVGQSNEVPVVQWLDEVIQADRFIFMGNVTEATNSQHPLDPSIITECRKLEGVEAAVGLRYVRPEYNGTIIYLVAIDAVPYAESTAKRVPGNVEGLEKMKRLPSGNVVFISENFALKHGKKPGDTLLLPGPRGPVELRILDTIRDYSWSRGTIFIDRAVYASLFQDPMVDICHVFLKDGPSLTSEGSQNLSRYADARGLSLQDRVTVRKFLADLIDRVYVLAYLQQIVIAIVAALGVVTALLISVLQRKRELGLLLAIGATPGQIVRTVLWEAVLMGLFGTFLGILIGLPLEWYVLKIVMFEESGFLFDVLVPWRSGLSIAAGAIFVATMAGLLPALHAVRTRIGDAIAYQ